MDGSRMETGGPGTAEAVCFGMIVPAVVLVVEALPEHNTGTIVSEAREFISDDAVIVALTLHKWGVTSGLIGTALGDDPRGRRAAKEIKELGLMGRVRLSRRVTTPFEVNVSDPTGARTYFWQRDQRVLDTLDTADLSLIRGARLVYVDWYDGDHVLRAMDEAVRLGVPLFLNLEHGHRQPDILARYAPRATVCQAVTDAAQKGGSPWAVVHALLDAGVETALVTLQGDGCLVAEGGRVMHCRAPRVPVVDGCGAGALFSAGFIYGYLKGWDLEASARLATAAGSLKCTVVGPQALPMEDVQRLAGSLMVEDVHG